MLPSIHEQVEALEVPSTLSALRHSLPGALIFAVVLVLLWCGTLASSCVEDRHRNRAYKKRFEENGGKICEIYVVYC